MSGTKIFIKNHRILLVVIAAALLVSLGVIAARAGVESRNKSYDIVLDYQETAALAEQSGKDVSWWLAQFRDMEVTKVGLAEETLKSLMEGEDFPVSAQVMDLLTQEADWRDAYPADWIRRIEGLPFDSYDVMVDMRSKEAYDFVSRAFLERYGRERIVLFPQGNGGYALVDGTADMTLYTSQYKEQNSKGGGFMERIDVQNSKLMYLSLGLLPAKVERIQSQGMDVIPRTSSYSEWNDERYAKAVVAGYEANNITPAYMIAGGESVPGFDDGVSFIRKYIADNNIVVGLIEDTTQLQNILQFGILNITRAGGYKAVRVFSVWDYIQNRYQYYGYEGAKEIENTLFRAVTERNIRVIYYKPIREMKDLHTYVTDTDEYRTLFENLRQRLARHGISYGAASVMDPYQVPFPAKLLAAVGCVAAGVLLLHLVFPISLRARLILLGIGSLGAAGALFVAPSLAILVTSLLNALIFACLCAVFYTHQAKELYDRCAPPQGAAAGIAASAGAPAGETQTTDARMAAPAAGIAASAGAPAALGWKQIIPRGALILLVSVGIALLGGLMTAAPLSSVNFMLEIDIFRGVKAAQILPIAFFIIIYLAYFGFGERKQKPGQLEFQDLKEMMNTSVKVWMVLLAVILAAGGVYYILRTGHEVVQAGSTEMLFRNELEELLIARPRTKEFLFAFPAVMLMVYTACKRLRFWTVLFGLSGVVGMTSVINTFMHIRTPLYLGFTRTAYSLLFGILIGIVALLIFDGLFRLCGRWVKRYGEGAAGV
jgi:hypothetical protein